MLPTRGTKCPRISCGSFASVSSVPWLVRRTQSVSNVSVSPTPRERGVVT
jgi:hypothetical protein